MQRTLFVTALMLASGCSPEAPSTDAVSLSFKAVVGDKAFACGQSYSGVGGQTLLPADFRLYVHDLVLLTTSGQQVPVTLDADGKWQSGGVALLDFEDRTGDCAGTTEVNTRVQGTVAGGAQTYSGLRFTVGVPFAQNHQDQAAAPSPLNLTGMFWSWQSGYKFVRIEGKTASGSAYLLHLGSTGCAKDGSGQVTSCTSPNRATVTLSGFDPARNTIAVDLAALLAGSDLSASAECHSQSDKAACAPYFKALGRPFMEKPATQSAFRVE